MQNQSDITSAPALSEKGSEVKRYDAELSALQDESASADALHTQIRQLERYTYALCHGDLDAPIPPSNLAATQNIASLQSQLLMTRELLRRAVNGDYTGRLSSGMICYAQVNTLLEQLSEMERLRLVRPSVAPDTDSMLLMVLESIEVIIVVVEKATHQVRFMNQYACSSLGLSSFPDVSDQMHRHPLIQLLVSYHGSSDDRQAARWEAYCSNPMRWFNVSTSLIQSGDGQDLYIHSATDITEQKRNARRLENFANLDPLTALPNRREGYAQLEYELNNPRNDILSVCFIDMDNLKTINDIHGHEEGDQALLQLASSIRNCIRPRDHACRFAGDEFIIVFPRCDKQRASAIIERIKADIDRAGQASQKPYHVHFSYGVVQWTPGSRMDAKKLLEAADNEMYHAKKKRKERMDES